MKILVAEDEYYTRKSFVKTIKSWNKEIELLEEAENGLEAVRIMGELPIDLAFIDIRMPKMNGLELVKYIEKNHPSILTVIVSGYADFNYAQEAISLGVYAYLLKPVKKDELFKLLDETGVKIAKSAEQRKEQEECKKKILQAEEVRMERELNLAIMGMGGIHPSMFAVFPSFANGISGYRISVFQTYASLNGEQRCEILGLLRKLLGEGCVCFQNNRFDREIISIHPEYMYGKNPTDFAGNNYIRIFRYMADYCQRTFSMTISQGISSTYNCREELPSAYKEARDVLCRRLITGWGLLFFYDDEGKHKPSSFTLNEEYIRLLKAEITGANKASVRKTVIKLLEDIKKNRTVMVSDLDYVFKKTVMLINDMIGEINCGVDKTNQLKLLNSKELSDFSGMDDLIQFLVENTEKICNFFAAQRKEEMRSVIDDLKEYIESNYFLEISLKELAKNRYYMSFPYLSKLFKSVVGVGFSGYLLQVRMIKALELIEKEDLSLSEIANFVGYNDISYFIKIFKEYYGHTPGQVKKSVNIAKGG